MIPRTHIKNRQDTTHKRALHKRALPIVAIAFFTCAVLYRLVFMGQALYWGDIWLFFRPPFHLVREALRDGHLPLWNAYMLAGQPMIGNPQAIVLYPTIALLCALPMWQFLTVNTAIHLFLAGIGSYWYLRRLCGDRFGALLGAFTYLASGFMIARIQFPNMIMSAAYFPFMLILIDRLVERPTIAYGSWLALVCSLELYAGHSQMAYMCFVGATIYTFARLYQTRHHKKRAKRAFWFMCAALGVGILSASFQILPALQLFMVCTRSHLTYMQANRFILIPQHLITFLFPNFFGDPSQGNYWADGNIWEPCIYVGIIPLALALWVSFCHIHRPAVRFYIGSAIISTLLAMGRFGGLYWIAFYVMPGLSSFHDPARFTFWMTFAIAALAAVGMRRLRDMGVNNRIRALILVCAAANLCWYASSFNPTTNPTVYAKTPAMLPYAPKAGVGRVYSVMRDSVWQRYINYDDYGPNGELYAQQVVNTLTPGLNVVFGVEDASGYEPVPVKAPTEVDGLARSAIDRQDPHLPALLGLMNVHQVIFPQGARYSHPGLIRKDLPNVAAYSVVDPYPRAWLVRKTVRVDQQERILPALSAPSFDPKQMAIVTGSDGLGFGSCIKDEKPTTKLNFKRITDTRFEVTADAGTQKAFMVWSSAYYPGWKATLDGKPVMLERTNHAFTGMVIPTGKHEIVLVYKPFIIELALYLSIIGFSLIAFGLTYHITKGKYRGRIRTYIE